MAKNKKNSGAAKQPRQSRGARSRLRVRPLKSVGSHPYKQLLMDPCNGPVHSVYPGEEGIVQRFVSDFTVNTAVGSTSGYLVFIPASNVVARTDQATSSTAAFPGTQAGPGASFLGATSAKLRPVAACVTMIPSAVSYNTLTGEMATANISANTVSGTTSLSPDQVFQLCSTRTVLSKRSYDSKWYPNKLDGTYSPNAGGASAGTYTLGDPADNNAIVIAWRGYPAAVALSVRLTLVAEWTPSAGQGLAVTTAPRLGENYERHAAELHNASPHWWTDIFSDIASHGLQEIGRGLKYVTSMGVQQGVKYATNNLMPQLARAAPLLLTL